MLVIIKLIVYFSGFLFVIQSWREIVNQGKFQVLILRIVICIIKRVSCLLLMTIRPSIKQRITLSICDRIVMLRLSHIWMMVLIEIKWICFQDCLTIIRTALLESFKINLTAFKFWVYGIRNHGHCWVFLSISTKSCINISLLYDLSKILKVNVVQIGSY